MKDIAHASDLESGYGTCLALYDGEADLTFPDESATEACRFQAGQLPDGQIVVILNIPSFSFRTQTTPVRIEGTTREGWKVVSCGKITEINYLPPPGATPNRGALRLNQLKVTRSGA